MDAAVLGDRLPEGTQSAQAAPSCSAGIERARKCLQGYQGKTKGQQLKGKIVS